MKNFRTFMVGLCLAFTLAVSAQPNTTILGMHQEDFAQLDLSRVPTGLLMDKAIPIIPFNDSVRSVEGNLDTWDQLYYQLKSADLYNSMESLSLLSERRRSAYDLHDAAPLMILDYNYNVLNQIAIDSGLVALNENGYLNEVSNQNSSIPLYSTKSFSYMAVGTYSFSSAIARIFVTQSFLFANNCDYEKQVYLNRGDGHGFVLIPWETVVEISVQDAAKAEWVLDYSNVQAGPHSALNIKFGELYTPGYKTTISDRAEELTSSREFNGNYGKGRVDVVFGKDANGIKHTCYTKPFIIVEGIDFGYRNHRYGYYGEGRPNYKYGSLGFCDLIHGDGFGFNMEANSWSDAVPVFKEGKNFVDQLNDMGYDVIYLDFYDGATFIEINSMVLVELINKINAEKCSKEEIVIMGPSMGGQITKFTLSYMEHHQIPHCVREFISFDSQYKGAHIPLAIQSLLATMDLSSSLKDMNENILLRPAARQLLAQQYVEMQTNAIPLEKQLLRNSKKILLNDQAVSSHRNDFLANLEAVGGFPKQCRLVAICNGSASGIGFPDLTNGKELFDIKLSAPILGDINIRTVSGTGTTMHSLGGSVDVPNVVYGISFYNKIINRTYKELFIGVPNTMVSLDEVPSASRNDIKTIDAQVRKVDPNAIVNAFGHTLASFCPSVSTLDFKTDNWKENIFYKDPNKDMPSLFRPFDAYYAHPDKSPLPFANEPHVWISRFGKYGANTGINSLGQDMEGNADWGIKQTLMNEDMLKGALPNINSFTNTLLSYVNLGHWSRKTMSDVEINKGGQLQINGDRPFTQVSYSIGIQNADWRLTQGTYLLNTTVFPLAGTTFEVSTCNCENPVITINNEGEIEVGDENAAYPKNNKGVLRIRKGGKLIINTGGMLYVHPGSRVIIEEGAELVYYPGAQIILQGKEAVLEIIGIVKIENGAVFNFGHGLSEESGYLICSNENNSLIPKFASSTSGSINLNSSQTVAHLLTLKGINVIDESISALTLENTIIESTDGGLLQCRNANVLIKNCVFTSNTSDRSTSNGLSTIGQFNVTVQNTKFIKLGNGFNINNREKNNAKPTITSCTFDNCSVGIISEGMALEIEGSIFKNCDVGLNATIENPSKIRNSTFLKNSLGAYFNKHTTYCHLEGNIFNFCDVGLQTAEYGSGHYSLQCNSFSKNTLAAIKVYEGGLSLSPNKQYHGETGGSNTFSDNHKGIVFSNTEIYLEGGYNNFISASSSTNCNFVNGMVPLSLITNGNEISSGGNYWMPAPSSGDLKNGNGFLYNLTCAYAGSNLGIAYLSGNVKSASNTSCFKSIDQNDALNNTSSTNISNLSVSPNPTSGFATLTFDYLPSAGVSATIKIINSHGTLLQTISPVSIANGSNSIAINLSSYTAGVYYIEIILPTGNYHYSAVKY